jgi:hypothetical protein
MCQIVNRWHGHIMSDTATIRGGIGVVIASPREKQAYQRQRTNET